MEYETLQFALRDGIARVTLNRPEAFNAMNLACMRELLDVANRCGSDRGVRAVVLTGSGDKAFCAGGDVGAFAAEPATVDLLIKEMTTVLHAAISRFAWMDAPVIARVNGVAAGAGLSLVAAADIAIASDAARFTSAYTQIGLSPDGSSTYFLPRLIGQRRATELYLTNRTLSAREAVDWGLVNDAVPAGELDARVDTLASRLAQGPTRAFGGVKKLMLLSTRDGLESQMENEARQIVELSRSHDGLEGVAAFSQRRRPDFTGR